MDLSYENKYLELEKNWWWFTARRELILQLVKDIPYNNVIEIGCGSGELSAYLKNYTGVDISPNSCKFIIGTAHRLPIKNNSFDLVLLLDILEHVDDLTAMKEVSRILKPEGHVIVTVPAFMFLWSKHDFDNQHRRRYRCDRPPFRKFHRLKWTYWNCVLFPLVFLTKNKESKLIKLPKIVNFILTKILRFENYLISKNIRLPIGVSLVYVLRNNKTI